MMGVNRIRELLPEDANSGLHHALKPPGEKHFHRKMSLYFLRSGKACVPCVRLLSWIELHRLIFNQVLYLIYRSKTSAKWIWYLGANTIMEHDFMNEPFILREENPSS
jgi:hypothetical protein